MQLPSQFIHQVPLYKPELHNPSMKAESKKPAELDELQSTFIAPYYESYYYECQSRSITWLLLLLIFLLFHHSLVYN